MPVRILDISERGMNLYVLKSGVMIFDKFAKSVDIHISKYCIYVYCLLRLVRALEVQAFNVHVLEVANSPSHSCNQIIHPALQLV